MNIDPVDFAETQPATIATALQRPPPLSDAQKWRVAAILPKFDPARLTTENAQHIHVALREAGIHGGFGFSEAIEAAGFDSFALRVRAVAAPQAECLGQSDRVDPTVDISL